MVVLPSDTHGVFPCKVPSKSTLEISGLSLKPSEFYSLPGSTTGGYPLVMTYKKLLNMAIEIVDFPIKNGDFPSILKDLRNLMVGYCIGRFGLFGVKKLTGELIYCALGRVPGACLRQSQQVIQLDSNMIQLE